MMELEKRKQYLISQGGLVMKRFRLDLLLAVLFVPGLKQLFLVSPQFGISQLGIITALAVVPTLIIQTIKLIAEKRQSA